MDVLTPVRRIPSRPPVELRPARRHPWVGAAMIGLGVGLAANSLLGPFVADVVRYPFSATLLNQTIGLEAVSLFLVAPLSILAGVLTLRGNAAGPVVGFGPAAYAAYMLVQYVVGPEYANYPGVLLLHLSLFVLGAGTAVATWNAVERARLPRLSEQTEGRYGVLLLVLAGFILSRYLPALFAGLSGDPLAAEFRQDVSMYWTIFLLDLGLVVPGTIAAAVALLRGVAWGRKALFAVLGWFALVPPSVAAMGWAMVINDDPNASLGQTVVLTVAAVAFAAVAVRLYRPLVVSSAEVGAARRRGGSAPGRLVPEA